MALEMPDNGLDPSLKVRTLPLSNLRMIVNGDDIVFPATRAQYANWKWATKQCGLETSIGKTYFSDRFFVINSWTFTDAAEHVYCGWQPDANITAYGVKHQFDMFSTDVTVDPLERDDEHITRLACAWRDLGMIHQVYRFHRHRLPCLNLGLLYGLKRSGIEKESGVSSERDRPLGDILLELMHGFSYSECVWLMDRFIHYNRTQVTYGNIPRHVPTYLGGFGLPSIGPEHRVSNMDDALVQLSLQGLIPPCPPLQIKAAGAVFDYSQMLKSFKQNFGVDDSLNGTDPCAECIWIAPRLSTPIKIKFGCLDNDTDPWELFFSMPHSFIDKAVERLKSVISDKAESQVSQTLRRVSCWWRRYSTQEYFDAARRLPKLPYLRVQQRLPAVAIV